MSLQKKKILLFMNCHAKEYLNYLNQYDEIRNHYSLEILTSYEIDLHSPASLHKFQNVDFVIMNNIKSYPLYTKTNIQKHVKNTCKIIVVEYIRFGGFFPLPSVANTYIQIDDESFKSKTFADFSRFSVNETEIANNFKNELNKFKLLNDSSDIKFYDFFLKYYKTKQLFRDNNHLTSFFFLYLSHQLAEKICNKKLIPKSKTLSSSYTPGHSCRYRPVLSCVKKKLNLLFSEECTLFNRRFNLEQLYKYVNFIRNKNDKACTKNTDTQVILLSKQFF